VEVEEDGRRSRVTKRTYRVANEGGNETVIFGAAAYDDTETCAPRPCRVEGAGR